MYYWNIFTKTYSDYAAYVYNDLTHPSWHNYFYWLIAVSIFFMLLEWSRPWRVRQGKFRKDFWLDAFYMFFNFFIFSLIIYDAASDVVVNLFNDGIMAITSFGGIRESRGFNLQASNPMRNLPMWAILIIGFIVRDFVQWWVHRLLHKVDRLWEFHKVHHSVEQMGFAAHLRYHWMENIVYRTIEYIPLALLGIGLYDFFIIHIFTIIIGHYNHSNISIDGKTTGAILGGAIAIIISIGAFDINLLASDAALWQKSFVIFIFMMIGREALGPFMKYIFNSPEMHIWHHSYELPENRLSGINFGISLAVWDYIFGTAYIPHSGRDIRLGFTDIEEFPDTFVEQNIYGL